MALQATNEQLDAIRTDGNLLVSAAAGSGKTAVLVERVIRRLTDPVSPIGADRLLIVTYTNAAAAEMRTRIEKRLDEECSLHPDDVGLLRQKQLLQSAQICTIDSYCIDLVRENFQKAGVSPDFKISEEAALRPINEEVLDRILAEFYAEKDPLFYELLDLIGSEYGDRDFKETVFDLFTYSRQFVSPEDWFRSLSAGYQVEFARSEWFGLCMDHANEFAQKMLALLNRADDAVYAAEALTERYAAHFALVRDAVKAIGRAAACSDWNTILQQVTDLTALTLPKKTKAVSGLPETEIVTRAWENVQSHTKRLARLFFEREEVIAARSEKLAAPLALLTDLLIRFDKELFAEYLDRNILTFHNTEHLAFSLLSEENRERDELLARYDEIMVDEYQDTNDLQDRLFYILSGEGKRLFVVGDVKQSIYGFRGANPGNFRAKKEQALPPENAGQEEPKKVILGKNFRSKPEICAYINMFFENMMTGQNGDVPYSDEERLIPAAKYPPCGLSAVDLDLIEVPASINALQAEAHHIAGRIKEIMNAGPCIRVDENTLREAVFSDFAILLRSAKTKAPVIAEQLRREGIPVNIRDGGFAEEQEIAVMLSLLQIVDNPDSDIDLVTVMMSPLFGFSAEEMAQIRIGRKDGSLLAAVVAAAENGQPHCAEFLEKTAHFRRLSVTLPPAYFLSRVLNETDYLNTVSVLEDGERKRGNLLLLVRYAETYSKDQNGGIGGFLRFMRKMEADTVRSAAVTAGDTVHIMSIHGSKGLQFPVCIVANTAAHFNTDDQKKRIVYSEHLGMGLKYYEETAGKRVTTPAREVICEEQRRRAAQEEKRLFYVALTRAEDKLIMTATVGNLQKAVESGTVDLLLFGENAEEAARYADSYAKWLLLTALLHPDGAALRGSGSNLIPHESASRFVLTVSEGCVPETAETEATELPPENKALVEQMRNNMEYTYPYAPLLGIEAKASVSVLANRAESEKYAFSDRPAFMSDGGITATERGTAMHKVMQFFNFDQAENVEQELDRLYEWQFISERERDAINRTALRAFFASGLFRRIRRSPLVKREMRFLTEVPASKIDPSLQGRFEEEGVVIQGAVDLCFEEEDGIVVLDFKTDRVSRESELAASYGEQLAIYALACEKIFRKPVKQKLIYSFALSRQIEI